ncbi:Cadherin-1 [Merluccius polli]|uniref:Cadherin-1 n=1 Tax=Merluccius polli TaxID=89951 RepID=A0AA47P3Z7_MERPO|nr:Cadherin-1 [Merluccius polli]
MGPTWLLELGILIVIAQAWASPSEQQKCVAGFKMDGIVFKVERELLHRGRLLGNVGFDDCMGRNRVAFNSSDSHFKVELDGTLKDTPDLPVLHFPTFILGLHRQKRTWVVPPFNLLENDRGPFPKALVQIRSSADAEVKIEYQITGPGSNEPPINLFTIDKTSGQIYVTQPLDREKQDIYLLKAHANVANGVGPAEAAMDVVIKVLDANDNRPIFTKEPFVGEVAEDSAKDFEVITIVAKDADDPTTNNAIIHYKILSQKPNALFDINPVTGAIRYLGSGLDREVRIVFKLSTLYGHFNLSKNVTTCTIIELKLGLNLFICQQKYTKYTLEVEAADMEGAGMAVKGHVILTVTDSNDNAPAFAKSKASTVYEAMVPENKVGALVLKMSVTDGDEPHSPAWNAKFKIVGGDFLEQFAVETGPGKQEGIITTVKGLDYETSSTYTLLVTVENEVPFAGLRPTATATVVVSVEDVNEAPVFSPSIKVVGKKEDLSAGTDIVQYTATDPDTARSQKVSYKIIKDPAQWLSVNKDTGMIKVKSAMDREGHYVEDNKYTVLIAAYDNDDVPATGTGTLEIKLEDVNDNIPSINERIITVCNRESAPHLLSVTDADGPDFSAPYTVSLQGMSKNNWTAKMNDTKTGIILTLVMPLTIGDYSVVLRVADNHGLEQDNTVQATVCDCSGADVKCKTGRVAGIGLPYILGILGAILLLLLLGLLLLMFLRRRGGEKKEPLLQEDDIRDNIYYYDEEGGGEDDQDYYDLSVLHRGLDNRPDVFRNDVVPNFLPAAQYRPRPANPEDIGNFIDDNLKAADNDPLAPPYDSLLVFDDEGKGSDAGTLSSLNSSSSGDQEYDCLNQWGPRFKKLADMYGGGEDDML